MADEREKQVYTIDDIAKELGISKTTVSRALSGKGRLSEETRARVLAFAEQHDYRPNAVAQSLAQSCTYNIGLLLPGDSSVTDAGFFHECMVGICETAAQHGYDVLVTMERDDSAKGMQRILDNRKVDGIIASRSVVDSPVISLLKSKKLPFMLIGSTNDPDVLYVDNNNQEACRDLAAVLISRGARRMALLGGAESYYVTRSRLQGFKDACQQLRLPWKEQLVFKNLSDSTQVAAAIRESVRLQSDCILCMDDFLCNLALIQLRELKVRVPEDIKIACFYDDRILEHTLPPVTSLRFDAAELGRAACRELLHLLAGEAAQSRVLPGYQIILRDSTN